METRDVGMPSSVAAMTQCCHSALPLFTTRFVPFSEDALGRDKTLPSDNAHLGVSWYVPVIRSCRMIHFTASDVLSDNWTTESPSGDEPTTLTPTYFPLYTERMAYEPSD